MMINTINATGSPYGMSGLGRGLQARVVVQQDRGQRAPRLQALACSRGAQRSRRSRVGGGKYLAEQLGR
jgi:hypothetical protein